MADILKGGTHYKIFELKYEDAGFAWKTNIFLILQCFES